MGNIAVKNSNGCISTFASDSIREQGRRTHCDNN